MRIADLFDCFDRHLHNLEIVSETNELFTAKVLEDYIINLTASGRVLGQYAEDIYLELQADILIMLRKKTYGFFDLNEYRDFLRDQEKSAS